MAAHDKLLERMRQSSAGWSQSDLKRLYEGFGFRCREGGNHSFYQHPDYPQLLATVARHNELPKAYAETAIRILDQLAALQRQQPSPEPSEPGGPTPQIVAVPSKKKQSGSESKRSRKSRGKKR